MKTIIVLIAVVVVGGALWWTLPGMGLSTPLPQEPVFCTADAFQCPDGTFVGRTGPNCEFVCPGAN